MRFGWMIGLAALLLAGCQGATNKGAAQVLSNNCEGVTAQPAALVGAESVTYRRASGRDLRLHIFRPDPAAAAPHHPAILFFFGGAWRIGEITAFEGQARAFAQAGYVAVLADYRVKCRDGTTPFASVSDAEAAYRWMRGHDRHLGIDRNRIVLAGGSAGGQLALVTTQAARVDARPAALILFNPAVDLVGPAPWYLQPFARWISPSTLSLDHLPPMIIFHGKSDHTVPIDSVRRFCARVGAAGSRCDMVEYRGRAHGFINDRATDPILHRSPYEDTLARSLAFANGPPGLR